MRKTVVVIALAVATLVIACVPPKAQTTSRNRVSLALPTEVLAKGQSTTLVASSSNTSECRLGTATPRNKRFAISLRLPAASSTVTITISGNARRGVWYLSLTCGDQVAKGGIEVGGSRGRTNGRLFSRNRLVVEAVNHDAVRSDKLPDLKIIEGKDTGGPDPDFRVPFPCGEKWTASTYVGHGNALDGTPAGPTQVGRLSRAPTDWSRRCRSASETADTATPS